MHQRRIASGGIKAGSNTNKCEMITEEKAISPFFCLLLAELYFPLTEELPALRLIPVHLLGDFDDFILEDDNHHDMELPGGNNDFGGVQSHP